MTWALCLNCGEVKFGALCPCPKCQAPSTGDIQLDIAFSDHQMGRETLEEFGHVIETLHGATEDEELCFWAFIRFVSTVHASVLGVTLEPELQQRCDDLIASVSIPPVQLRPSPHMVLRTPDADGIENVSESFGSSQ